MWRSHQETFRNFTIWEFYQLRDGFYPWEGFINWITNTSSPRPLQKKTHPPYWAMAAALVPSVCGKLGQLGFFGSTSSGPPVSLNRTNLGEKDVINHNQMTAAIYCQPLIIKQSKVHQPGVQLNLYLVAFLCSYCSCWCPHSSGCRSHLFVSLSLVDESVGQGWYQNELTGGIQFAPTIHCWRIKALSPVSVDWPISICPVCGCSTPSTSWPLRWSPPPLTPLTFVDGNTKEIGEWRRVWEPGKNCRNNHWNTDFRTLNASRSM